ncbi:MOSC domain-containing protein [Metabacillus fastidiosus]|uniref:MOSC domain-containing protein n=1 Tax=Metabacillus fastidiosus TaxID=1458 RepID=UPI003AEF87E8
MEARRFRPNIIIDVPNGEGFVENDWVRKKLAIGDEVELKIMQNTKRCIMTTLAQGDLPKDTNVLKSIVKHNEGSFGVYASVVKKGEIKIGDQIKQK